MSQLSFDLSFSNGVYAVARRPARRTYRSSRPRRRYEWARTFFDATSTSGNKVFAVDLMSNYQQVLGADVAGTTVTRIRGELVFTFNYASGALPDDPALLNLGIRVDEDQVAGLTDTQQQAKLNQHYADWMYYRRLVVYPANTADGDAANQTVALRVPVDIKSQRRFDELQQSLFLFCGDFGDTLAGGTVHMLGDLHVLLKQP